MNAATRVEVQGLKSAGVAVRAAFDAMISACKAGVTTRELDDVGARVLAAYGATSAPQLYYDFPGATCISVNEQAAHGIPGDLVVADGDMINIDVSANLAGFVADMGQSFVVGQASPEQQRLCDAVEEAVHCEHDHVELAQRRRVGGLRRGFRTKLPLSVQLGAPCRSLMAHVAGPDEES